MNKRKIYVLIVVLGLAMVWLGFLFTYELKIVQQHGTAIEQMAEDLQNSFPQTNDDQMQAAGIGSGSAETEAGTGFPFLLAGLGLVFVIGGAFNYRHFRQQHKGIYIRM